MHLKMEQRGVRSELAERLRAGYRERVEQRLEHSAGVEAAKRSAAAGAADAARVQPREEPAAQINDLEEIRRQAREAWLRLRPKEAERGAQLRDRGQSAERAGRRGAEHESTPSAEEERGL